MLTLKKNGVIDIEINGADKKLDFLNLLLSKSGLDNIEEGRFFLKGGLKGDFKDEIPELYMRFGINDLSIGIPGVKDSIEHLKMAGIFVSGDKKDLSKAVLQVDTLNAILPDGFLDATFRLSDFSYPHLDYKITLEAKVKGFEKLVKQQLVDSLQGKIHLKTVFKGDFNQELSALKLEKSNLELQLDSVSFKIDSIFFSFMSGGFLGNYDYLRLRNLKVQSKNTDFKIDGTVQNVSNLLVDNRKRTVVRIGIQSDSINLSDFFVNNSTTHPDYEFRISNLDAKFTASANKVDLFEFSNVPKVSFNINRLKFEIDSITKPLNFTKGKLFISDYQDGYRISLNKAQLNMGKGELIGDFNYYEGGNNNASYKVKLSLNKLQFSDIIDKTLLDNTLFSENSPLQAKIDGEIQVKENRFEKLNLKLSNVKYFQKNNTLELDKVVLTSKHFYFKMDNLEELTGKFKLKIGNIKSKYYDFKDVVYSIDAKDKGFVLIPENDSILGVKAEGKLIAYPYESPATYSLDYSLKQFSVGQMFVNFLEDSLLSGKADFYINLNFKGNDEKSILSTMDGKIRMRAKNLTLYGAEMDEFLENYKKSQTLNLLDIGVTIYAGPIGLLATKGAGFARVKVTNRKKRSTIDRMISDWKLVGDSLIADDVALRTFQNRLALKGWYCYTSDSLGFKIGLLDEKGCSILSQGFSGLSLKPQMDNAGFFNAFQRKKGVNKECEVFYKGKLGHSAQY